MKRMKRFCALLLALCMLFALAPVASAANGTIVMNLNSNTMTVNGTSVAIDADAAIKPQVKKINGAGYTMLPLRAVVEAMGGTVAYNATTKVITMTYGGNTLTHTIGTKTATVNGASKTMTIASYAENNRTYVHLRAIELLSSSVKVDWNANEPNKVTITYPQQTASNTKNVNLTIKNATSTSYLQFTSLKLAPAGTTTFSGNLLSTTLIPGASRSLTMSIAPGKYDLRGTDINNNTYNWYNLDFTNVQSSAVLSLTSGSLFTLSLDSALVGDKTAQVTLMNGTGAAITGIEVYSTTSTASNATKVYSGTLYSGSYTTFALPYSSSAPYFYIKVTFGNGNSLTYNYVNLGANFVTVNLRGDGTFTYGSNTAASGVYFVNKTGSKLSTLQMKVGTNGSWSTNLLTSSLKSGDYIEITGYGPSDLRNQTVYFRTSTSGSGKNVKVSSTLKDSIVFSLSSSLSVKYDVKPGDVSYEEGLYLYNDSNIDFDYFYVINASDFDVDDYEGTWSKSEDYFKEHDAVRSRDDDYDPDDYAERVKGFDDGDEVLIDEWDADELAKADLYFMGEYTDKDNKDQTIYGTITVGKSSKFDYNVYLTIDTTSDGKNLDIDIDYDYTEDDEDTDLETGLIFYNDSGSKISKIYVKVDSSSTELKKASDFSSSDLEIENLKDERYEVADSYKKYSKIEDDYVHYYIVFDDSTADQYGTFSPTKSDKDNVCVTVKSTSSKTDWEYDWDDDDSSSTDSALYLYNDTGYDVDYLEIGIGSTTSKAKNDLTKVSFKSFDDEEVLEIEDIDVDDIEDMYIYVYAELDVPSSSDDDDEFYTYIEIDGDEIDEYVVLRLKSSGSLASYYDDDRYF